MLNTRMTMRQIILALAFFFTTFLCLGQERNSKPGRDFNQFEGILKEYYDKVFPLLYEGFSEEPIARYTSMPSFSNEYSFSIETIDNKEYVVSNRLSENYWYAKDRNKVKLISNKTEVHNDLYLKIVDLFMILTEQTKMPESETIGFDGVTYYFSSTNKNGKIVTGETWSPNEDSLLGRLVKICDNIYSFGYGDNICQKEILMDIDFLIDEFLIDFYLKK